MPIPRYMEKGSKGPHVALLQAFLAGKFGVDNLVIDGDYGDVTAGLVKKFQHGNRLEKDGNCGPKTRETMKTRGFNFEIAATAIPGTTGFVQPDGTKIEWSPEVETRPVEHPTAITYEEGLAVHDKTPEPLKRHAAAAVPEFKEGIGDEGGWPSSR